MIFSMNIGFFGNFSSVLQVTLALVFAPLLFGVINKTKAFFGGRKGFPLLQTYFDLAKLVRKGAVYSKTTSWVFRAGPVVSLAVVLMALFFVPMGGSRSVVAFEGDFLFLAYCLGVMRFFIVIAALDTGSSFEGMGASREVQFSALAEPALLIALAALAKNAGSLSLAVTYSGINFSSWLGSGIVLGLISAAIFIVLLTENARIPVDDPNTHLELTMIHEVMVLDHSGPDFAAILYGSVLKLWVFGSLFVGILLPVKSASPVLNTLVFMTGMFGLAVLIGVIESVMARMRLTYVPRFLLGATAFAVIALILVLR